MNIYFVGKACNAAFFTGVCRQNADILLVIEKDGSIHLGQLCLP